MSTEDHLPNEISELSQRLGQMSLPPARIDRDATLFQAGYAAAEADWRQRRGAATQLASWRLVSGVLAASVAVLALLLVESKQEPKMAAVAPQSSEVAATPPETRSTSQPNVRFEILPRLTRRELALRRALSETWRAPTTGDVSHTEIKSARDLLQEFLPQQQRGKS